MGWLLRLWLSRLQASQEVAYMCILASMIATDVMCFSRQIHQKYQRSPIPFAMRLVD